VIFGAPVRQGCGPVANCPGGREAEVPQSGAVGAVRPPLGATADRDRSGPRRHPVEEEADHLGRSVGAGRIGVAAFGSAAGPGVAGALDLPQLDRVAGSGAASAGDTAETLDLLENLDFYEWLSEEAAGEQQT